MKKSIRSLSVVFLCLFAGPALAQTYDSINFETPREEIVIDTTGGNLWQIGAPQKTVFDSVHSGSMAIMTDTINHYPANDTSSFIYVITNPFLQTCQTCIEFWQKYDMDTTGDQGIIEASYDGGDSWIAVKDTFLTSGWCSAFNWQWDYNSNTGDYFQHPIIAQGNSDGWILSSFCWNWYLPAKNDTIISNPDSLMVRFTFISDSLLKSKDGWMIDDIVTSAAGSNACSGIDEYVGDVDISIYPNPATTSVSLSSGKEMHNATLILINAYGQVVKQVIGIYGGRMDIHCGDLPCGLYYLRLTQANEVVTTKRLVIEH
jgi:hypothetical protein